MNDEEHKTPIVNQLEIQNIDNSPFRFYKGFQHVMDMIRILKKVNITENINSEIENALSSLNLNKNTKSNSLKCVLQNQNVQETINDFFSDKYQMSEIKKFGISPIVVDDIVNNMVEEEAEEKKEEMKQGGAVVVPKTYTKVGSTTPTDINPLHLFTGIDMFDNMHDLKEHFNKDVYQKNRCNINDDLLKNFFNLDTISYSVIENNKNQILKTIINKLNIEDNYIITSRTNDYNKVKDELFSVLDNFTVIVDVDYGKAYELIEKYANSTEGNGKVSIYKGVEVNYDPAGKKSDADIIEMGCKVLEGKPSIVYEPITNADCDNNNFEYKSIFQRLSTKSNVKLLIDDNNKSSALIEKSGEPGKYILADKTFAEKGDKNSNDYKELISRFINFIKGIGDLSEPKKFSAEHYLAKRMGDACQAIAALYLPNSILVTYDILLVLFALSIGVKHIIHSHVKVGTEKLLTLYVDKTSHRIDNRTANTYNEVLSYGKINNIAGFSDIDAVSTNNIGDIEWDKIKTKITEINGMVSEIYGTLQQNAVDLIETHSANVNESSRQIETYLNSVEFTRPIINTNSDMSNENYKKFIKSLNDVKLYLHNYFLHKNYVDSIKKCIDDISEFSGLISEFNSSISSSSSAASSTSQELNEQNTKEYVENVSKYLSSIKVLQSILNNPVKSFTSIINTNIKLNLIKIYKNASTSQRLKAMICSFNNSEFETNTSYSFLENVFLDLKKYSISGGINTIVNDTLLNNKLQSIIATSNSIVLKHGDMLSTRIDSLKTQIQAQQSTIQAQQSTIQAQQSTIQAQPLTEEKEEEKNADKTSSLAMVGGNIVINEIKQSLRYIDEIKNYYNDDTETSYKDVDNKIVYENQEKMMCLFEIYMNYNDLQEEEKKFIRNYLTIEGTNYIQEIIDFFNTPNVKDNYLKENITDEEMYDYDIEIQNRKKRKIIQSRGQNPQFSFNINPFNVGYTAAIKVKGGIRKITRRNKNKKEKNTKQSKRYVNKKSKNNNKNNKMKLKNYTRKHK